jgi:putative ABC transport system permease protein
VENRRKEVSIRKVIGASRLELMRLLSFGFVRLLLISGAIAIPIGFMMSFFFLQNFLERVGLLFPFVLVCFAAMFCIGLVTIGSQVLVVTAQNPVNALRED